jgi:hypothetical protein
MPPLWNWREKSKSPIQAWYTKSKRRLAVIVDHFFGKGVLEEVLHGGQRHNVQVRFSFRFEIIRNYSDKQVLLYRIMTPGLAVQIGKIDNGHASCSTF